MTTRRSTLLIAPTRFAHMVLAFYVTAMFVVAGVSALRC
jgi:cytochrome bd-type quinol oxidase subunit 1